MEEPLVSICCITYNHERYIKDALDGFVMQKTSFQFEIVISDDCSKDNARGIIEEYKGKYPELFRDISPIANLGSFANFRYVQEQARGKYIAFCEGDDYWTDPYKLQKQVDFMEAHPECGICYTDYNHLEQSCGKELKSMFELQHKYRPQTYEQHLLKPGYLAPMTWLYRRDLQEMLTNSKVYTDGTYAYMLEFMHNTEVAYLPFVSATYRSHAGSASSPIGANAFYRYSKGVFDTQRYYSDKYPCAKELRAKILMRGYLDVLPIAVMATQEDFIEEVRTYFKSQDLDIDLVIRELKQGEMRRRSKAYRLGKAILKPFKWLKEKL